MKTLTRKFILAFAAALFFGAAPQEAVAGSATWSANPTSGDWNTAVNWTPPTVPNSSLDVGTFSTSGLTKVGVSARTEINGIIFSPGADSFTISAEPGDSLIISGDGITNSSGSVQTFVSENDGGGLTGGIFFENNATAGEMTSFAGPGGLFVFSNSATAASASFDVISTTALATLTFEDNSTAADANITVRSFAPVNFFGSATAANSSIKLDGGGFAYFGDTSTAAYTIATIDNDEEGQFVGSLIEFQQSSTAANGSFIANGATSSTGFASSVLFFGASTAGEATFVLNGGSAGGAAGTVMDFFNTSKANNATITVNGGTNGGEGASVLFHTGAKGGTARFILSGNGTFDISDHNSNPVTTGSIEGSGVVLLGARQLAVGSNNLSTTFAGSIQDGSNGSGGSLSKVGTGAWTLSGANTYTGGTTVSAGALVVSNTTGSATGTGSVTVNGGTLGGGGSISGAVTIGSGSASGATLQPSFGTNKKVTLTIQGPLTFKSDATYSFRLKSKSAEVIANGVTIESGAQFNLTAPNKKLPVGKSATVIKNTAATAISGTFANLPDGGTITRGANTFKASYEGGGGNDLTLTVQ